jgi:hypothetical protein
MPRVMDLYQQQDDGIMCQRLCLQARWRGIILAGLACLLLVGVAGAVTVSAGEASGAQGSTVQVPLSIDGAMEIGSMDLTLQYDPEIAQAIGVDSGTLAKNSYLESNTGTPGTLKIALADSGGISGSGPVVIITFLLKGGVESSTALTIEEVALHDRDLNSMDAAFRNGVLRITEGAAVTQSGNGIAMTVLATGACIAAVFLIRRNRRGQS